MRGKERKERERKGSGGEREREGWMDMAGVNAGGVTEETPANRHHD